MAGKNPRVDSSKKEIRKIICKGCKCEIDDAGCGEVCLYNVDWGVRDQKMVEVHVYILDRIEPHPDALEK